MAIYLGLGSNLGDRRENLRRALAALNEASIGVERVSPVVESPALLPPDAPSEWNAPFLNLVTVCVSKLTPEQLLPVVKDIERRLGRCDERRWAPRPIDIDLLLYDDAVIRTDTLTVPHPGLAERAFFLTPLAALAPRLTIPGLAASARQIIATGGTRIPQWMGIINLTPDSFSDGGVHASWQAVAATIDAMVASGVHILDFGAESTRPGAEPLTADAEWARLEEILARALEKFSGDPLRPRLSVDSYHAPVAAKALALGVDIINDVGGLTDPGMIELAATSDAEFVAMHNLGLPADRRRTLPTERSAADQVEEWLDRQLASWQSAGIDPDRLIFDPGIGFGKNPLQSLELLRDIGRFNRRELRLLVGHSRKSFMQGFAGAGRAARDLVTIGGSLALCGRGVDILRVHNVGDHVSAYRGWSQLQRPD